MRHAVLILFFGFLAGLGSYVFGTHVVLPALMQTGLGFSPDSAFIIAVVSTGALFGLLFLGIRRLFVSS